MPYTTRQHMEARMAAAYGYTVSGVPLAEFVPGDGIIVLTQKGEPINSGVIEELRFGYEEGGEAEVPVACKVNGAWYYKSSHLFRTL